MWYLKSTTNILANHPHIDAEYTGQGVLLPVQLMPVPPRQNKLSKIITVTLV